MGTSDQPTGHEPVRVAIDVGPLYGHRTGVGHAVAGMVAALSGRSDVALDRFVLSSRAQLDRADRRLPLPGIVASHLWSRSSRPRADRWLGECDVVHGTNYVAPPSRHPTVVSVYDCWFLRHPEHAVPLVRRAGERLRHAVRAGAFVHASSQATAADVRELLGTDRVVAVPLGPPPSPPAPDGRPPEVAARLGGHPFVFAVATEERRKGLPVLVRAFAELAAEHAGARLVLAGGRGDASADVDAAVASLTAGAADRVERLGPIDDHDKHWLLRHAAVVAYPSLDEGFGFPVLEAQQAGTPVVASDVGSVREVGGEAVLLAPPRDASALAERLDRALSDGALRLGLIEAGHRNVHRFSWDATAAGLVALYHTANESAR